MSAGEIFVIWAVVMVFVALVMACVQQIRRSPSGGEAEVRLHGARRQIELTHHRLVVHRDAERTRQEIDHDLP